MKLNFAEIISNQNILSIKYTKIGNEDFDIVIVLLTVDRNIVVKFSPDSQNDYFTCRLFINDILVAVRRSMNINDTINTIAKHLSKNDISDL